MTNKKNTFLLLFSGSIGFVLTILFLDFKNIGFTNTDWINSYDLKSDFLALKFFLDDKWRFPIGFNPNYGDIPNSIVFSGAVPIFSFISKIFKYYLPYNFHFFSVWILICFTLQFFFSFKIIYFFTRDYKFSALSAIFFTLSPILIYRMNVHLSLGAHWLILASFFLDLDKKKEFLFYKKTFLIVLSSLVHFYFTIILIIMQIFFSFFDYLKNKNFRFFIIENFSILIILILSMYITGYFIIPATDALGYGFGYYKSNLLTFFDPTPISNGISWSMVLPDITNTNGEKEGFAYFGLGIILTFLICIISYLKNLSFKITINYRYLLLCIFLFFLSITTTIHFGRHLIIDLEIPKIIYAPLSIIRASGRLIWPVYYFLIILFFIKYYKLNFKKKILIFSLILIIQFIDISFALKRNFNSERSIDDKYFLKNDIWKKISNDFDIISNTLISNRSRSFQTISSLLIQEKFEKTNFFRLGRYNREVASLYRANFNKMIIDKDINNNTAYVIDDVDHLRHIKYLFENSNHGIFQRNDVWLMLPNLKSHMNNDDFSKLNLIKYKNIQPNEKFQIKLNDENGILGFGWTHPSYGTSINTQSVWTEGFFSSLLFNLDKKNIKNIIINLDSSISQINNKISLLFLLNDNLISELNLEKDTKKIFLSFDDKNLLIGKNILTIQIKNPVTPLSKYESVDARLLGIRINNIEFK